MAVENPNAFKLWINGNVVHKYFSQTDLPAKEIKKIERALEPLELRARVQMIASELHRTLPQPYPKALKKLMAIVRKSQMKSFELWPSTEYIQTYGLDHVDISLDAMHELTQKFTAEFCVRPFINRDGEAIYNLLERWIRDDNEHVRRWLSEGTRPRLPWGEKLHSAVKTPERGLQILEQLRFDPSLYVRKSVANHLNDIAKDHPELVVQTLTRWQKERPAHFIKEFNFLSQRALRTLVKDGHPGALRFMGVDPKQKKIECVNFELNSKKIRIGQKIELRVKLRNRTTRPVAFILDYVVYFRLANGKVAPKVFKLRSGSIPSSKDFEILKSHSFRPITTRKFYPGEHGISIKLNGAESKAKSFILAM